MSVLVVGGPLIQHALVHPHHLVENQENDGIVPSRGEILIISTDRCLKVGIQLIEPLFNLNDLLVGKPNPLQAFMCIRWVWKNHVWSVDVKRPFPVGLF